MEEWEGLQFDRMRLVIFILSDVNWKKILNEFTPNAKLSDAQQHANVNVPVDSILRIPS